MVYDMIDDIEEEFTHLHDASLLLGSLVGDPHQGDDLVVDGRSLRAVTKVARDDRAQSAKIHNLARKLGLPEMVSKEAFLLWRRSERGRGTPSAALCLYIATRLHGRDVEPEEVMKAASVVASIRPGRFVNQAMRLATELGVEMPRRSHDRQVMRMVDELGIDRAVLQEAKRLYPEARKVHGGDPRTTLGALIYALVKSQSPDALTARMIAEKLSLAEYTIREAAITIRRALFKSSWNAAWSKSPSLVELDRQR